MIEKEIVAEINKENFGKHLSRLTDRLGTPSLVRRISFMILESGKDLDNRIKISNGKAQIVQKYKIAINEDGQRIKEEVIVDIEDNLEAVLKSIKLIDNFYRVMGIKPLRLIIQHENHIFKTSDYELKISRQFGQSDYFTYEIEAIKENVDLLSIEKELGLSADENISSPERRLHRATKVDLNMDKLSEKFIGDIINRYLAYQ